MWAQKFITSTNPEILSKSKNDTMTEEKNTTYSSLRFFRGSLYPADRLRSFLAWLVSLGFETARGKEDLHSLSEQDSPVKLSGEGRTIWLRKQEQQGWQVLDCQFEAHLSDELALQAIAWEKKILLDILNAGARQLAAGFASLQSNLKYQPVQALQNGQTSPPEFLWLSSQADLSQFTRWIENKEELRQWDGARMFYPKDLLTSPSPEQAAQAVVVFNPFVFQNLDPVNKAGVLRWFMQDYKQANEAILKTLNLALDDEYWEVRVTGMIAAARLGTVTLLKKIKHLPLPDSSRSGLDKFERSILVGFKQAAVALLAGEKVPDAHPGKLQTREEKNTHLLQCVAGENIKLHDKVFLMASALSEPMPEFSLPKGSFSSKLLFIDERYFLPKSGLEMMFIPPGEYWLGNHSGNPGEPSTIRKITLGEGFFISKYPVPNEEVLRSKINLDNPVDYFQQDIYLSLGFPEAVSFCEWKSGEENITLSLPTSDEWEIAARGNTGFLYPWGCGYFDGMLNYASPFGVLAMVGIVQQWTIKENEKMGVLRGGTNGRFRCYEQRPLYPEDTGTIRLLIRCFQ